MPNSSIQIYVNGELKELAQTATLADLVAQLGLTGKRIAVEINTDIVPRSQHSETGLKAGDQVEIVHAIGGG